MRQIKRVAVLGAGVMGSSIAAHLANAGLEVLLLDIVPREASPEQLSRGLTLESPEVRNTLAARGLSRDGPGPFSSLSTRGRSAWGISRTTSVGFASATGSSR
jgi:3-hydroxyacyl-CoA dehydrogenase